jgi:hypothetical protein
MAQMRRGGEGMFERADANNDGSVTKEEFIAARGDQFAKLDRNSDSYLDSTDMPKRMAERRKQNGGGETHGGQFDTNGDGKVSKDEFINGPTLMFDRADTDKNNVLDAKELAGGHGRSSQPWNGNEMNTYADDLAELMQALDLRGAAMFGFSTGGGEVSHTM